MKYRRFEDLPVWKSAIELAVDVFELARRGALSEYSGLRDQMERAALSVSNNIAEGFDRGTHEELVTFLYFAKGSAAEVRSMLSLLERLPRSGHQQVSFTELRRHTDEISNQLGAWLESLKDSNERGPRYRNATSRGRDSDQRRGEAFMEQLRRIQEEARGPSSSTNTAEP